jgi:hypothetical protein
MQGPNPVLAQHLLRLEIAEANLDKIGMPSFD